ncbi:MAG: 3-isopropylmalate dehydratase large subunit [Candidatus Omnitrophota bacterium]|nr:MAG: 3-isopropylmalate dehydratase large subunit [Candidatus Omnitrophota bacterium]
MGLTLIEKILLRHSSKKTLEDFLYVKVDFCFGNDVTAPLAVKIFTHAGFNSVFDSKKIGFVCDHFLPARDLKAANNVQLLKNFSKKYKIKNFFDINRCGIEHIFLLEEGLITPGTLIIGADSHTCTFGGIGCAAFGVGSTDLACAMKEGRIWLKTPPVIKLIYRGKLGKWITGKDIILFTLGKLGVDGALYKAMEFAGPVIKKLSVEDRLTITNMAIECGAKTGIIQPDEKVLSYLKKVANLNLKNISNLTSDKDAKYEDIIEIDVSRLQPQVAYPHLPSNVKPVANFRRVKLNQVFIGSCTNGRISDLRMAASILKGKKVKRGLRVIVIPATYRVYREAEREGLLKVFLEAGCIICPPTCGPCLGGHMGVIGKGEVALATSNRNFIGRMGHPQSLVYLSSPAVAAASAIKGRITHPKEVS